MPIRTIALSVILALTLSACASTGESDPQNESADAAVEQTDTAGEAAVVDTAIVDTAIVEDPFESFNRQIFAFNYRLDQWLLKPLAKGYDVITPRVIKTGVANFFDNLKEISNTANSLLQWKWGQAGNDSGRFLINSTLGLAGLFDVASKVGLPQSDGEDFGQTMAVWGVDAGPYLMLPLLGPATIRDGIAKFPDSYTNPVRYVDPTSAEYSLRALNVINGRAQLLKTESLLSGDPYTLLRDYYLQNRKYLINDGKIKDDFGSGGYGDDYYYDEYGSDEYGDDDAE